MFNLPKHTIDKMDRITPILAKNGVDMTGWDSIRESLSFAPPESDAYTRRAIEWLQEASLDDSLPWVQACQAIWMEPPAPHPGNERKASMVKITVETPIGHGKHTLALEVGRALTLMGMKVTIPAQEAPLRGQAERLLGLEGTEVVILTKEPQKDYQTEAFKTAVYPEKGTGSALAVNYAVIGLANEAGEVAGKWKKYLRGDYGENPGEAATGHLPEKLKETLAGEIGDVLWYVAALCSELGIKKEDVERENLQKLADRQARGVLKGDGDKR